MAATEIASKHNQRGLHDMPDSAGLNVVFWILTTFPPPKERRPLLSFSSPRAWVWVCVFLHYHIGASVSRGGPHVPLSPPYTPLPPIPPSRLRTGFAPVPAASSPDGRPSDASHRDDERARALLRPNHPPVPRPRLVRQQMCDNSFHPSPRNLSFILNK